MDRPKVVGITGGSGSGKTHFMRQLMALIPNAALHSMDNYYINIADQPKDKQGIENFDTPQSIDQKQFVLDLKELIAGNSIELKEYTFNNEQAEAKMIKIDSGPVILVEGILVYHFKEIRDLLDLKLFIDAPDYLMMKRRIIRDAKERGYDLDDVLYRYENHVMPAFEKHIGPSKKWADLVIPNHSGVDTAVQVVSSFLLRN